MSCSLPATPLEDDDLLEQIFLRLPLQHSSLPRASGVCKRWLALITDPKFIARFLFHHRKPPLLGFFHRDRQGLAFTPVIDPPDRIPPLQFDLQRYRNYNVLDCRHGRVLALHPRPTKLLVCDPITGKQHRVAVPGVFSVGEGLHGSVLCADRAQGHLHGACHSSPFKVVLMTVYADEYRPIARVYSSETRTWGKIISTEAPYQFNDGEIPGALVGNALYWLQIGMGTDILVLDLDDKSLAVIPAPPILTNEFHRGHRQIIQADDGAAAGLAILSYPLFQTWQRNVDCHGVATWVLCKTIDMKIVLGIPKNKRIYFIHGYCEDTDSIFMSVEGYVYMVQLKSMQSKRLHETDLLNDYLPLTSFYTPSDDCSRKKSMKRWIKGFFGSV